MSGESGGDASTSTSAASIAAALSSVSKPVAEVTLGRGIPALPKRMVEKMLAWEYVDLAELPPARANMAKEAMGTTPNVLLVQSLESVRHHRKIIPDITTWVQCYSIYVSVMATRHGDFVPELMAYMRDIIRASKQFKWPAWIVYDINYRQHMAETAEKDWSKVDASIYSRCLTGWARPTTWCEWCVSLDHETNDCPFSNQPIRARDKPRFQPYSSNVPRSSMTHRSAQLPTCIKFNRYGGDCKFGAGCKYRHVCSICGEPHPQSKCTKNPAAQNRTQ